MYNFLMLFVCLCYIATKQHITTNIFVSYDVCCTLVSIVNIVTNVFFVTYNSSVRGFYSAEME